MDQRLIGTVQRLLGRFGYQVQRLPVEGSLDRDLQRVLSLLGIEIVLDVGAHVGWYATRLRNIGFAGRIVSCEPSPAAFARAVAANVSECHQIALGDTAGTAGLHIYAEHEELTSLRRPSALGADLLGMTLEQTVSVRVQRLDEFVEDLGIHPTRAMVKIDTQGHDMAVIAGGSHFLAEAAALQVEIPMFGLYEGAPDPTEMLDHVLTMGFDLVGMYPVHEHPRPIVPVEFDGLFVRSMPKRLEA